VLTQASGASLLRRSQFAGPDPLISRLATRFNAFAGSEVYGAALIFYEMLKPQNLKGRFILAIISPRFSWPVLLTCASLLPQRTRSGQRPRLAAPCSAQSTNQFSCQLRTKLSWPQHAPRVKNVLLLTGSSVCLVQGAVPAVALALLRGLQDVSEPALPHRRFAVAASARGQCCIFVSYVPLSV
jgi:hypothetical protein